MRVNVINKTEFLNEYHFRSLCLLYFPQAKFPANDPTPLVDADGFKILELFHGPATWSR